MEGRFRATGRRHAGGDTINFKRETSFPNSARTLHLVEKFTRTDADTLMYEFTINDPSVWTGRSLLCSDAQERPAHLRICLHEGNYSMASICRARAAEKAAEAKASK